MATLGSSTSLTQSDLSVTRPEAVLLSCLLVPRLLPPASLQASLRTMPQKARVEAAKPLKGLGSETCFLHILLLKASLKVSPESTVWRTNSASSWESLQRMCDHINLPQQERNSEGNFVIQLACGRRLCMENLGLALETGMTRHEPKQTFPHLRMGHFERCSGRIS